MAAPPSEPWEPTPVLESAATNVAWAAFQEELLARRSAVTPELRRLLRQRIVVPPLGEPVAEVIQVASFWERLELKSRLALVAEFRLGREGGTSIEYRGTRGITASTADPGLVFDRTSELKANLDWLSAADGSGGASTAFNFGAFAVSFGADGSAAVTTDLGTSWLGLSLSGESAEGTVGIGPAWSPSEFFHLRLGVEENLKVSWSPEIQRGVSYVANVDGSRRWASSRALRDSVLLVIREALTCPGCNGDREHHCPQCGDERTVTCPVCDGTTKADCPRCSGSGQLSCPTTESCGSCGGDGFYNCGGCGGSGSTQQTCSGCGGSGIAGTTWVHGQQGAYG